MLANARLVDIELCGVRELHRGSMIARRRVNGGGNVVGFIEHLERIDGERAEAIAVFVPIAVELRRLDLVAERDPQAATVADERFETLDALRIQLGEIVDD